MISNTARRGTLGWFSNGYKQNLRISHLKQDSVVLAPIFDVIQRPFSASPGDKIVQKFGTTTRLAGGIPDFVEKWNPTLFKQVGSGFAGKFKTRIMSTRTESRFCSPRPSLILNTPLRLVALVNFCSLRSSLILNTLLRLVRLSISSYAAFSAISWYLPFHYGFDHVVLPGVVTAFTGVYWSVGLSDLNQTTHTLRRNFPFLCHLRYIFESVRPEIQQYFIESDSDATPFSRSMRTQVYKRSKAQSDTRALGTMRDVYEEVRARLQRSDSKVPSLIST